MISSLAKLSTWGGNYCGPFDHYDDSGGNLWNGRYPRVAMNLFKKISI